MNKVLPRKATPELSFPLVGGDTWNLQERKPQGFTLIVVYRGHHCPLCKKQLQEFESVLDQYEAAGIEVVAVSANTQELAAKAVEEWQLEKLSVGYGLSPEDAKRWGLYVSRAVKDSEPAFFLEPGIFVVQPGGTLYAAMVQTMPFSRPPASKLLSSLQWILENGYPARGEASYEVLT